MRATLPGSATRHDMLFRTMSRAAVNLRRKASFQPSALPHGMRSTHGEFERPQIALYQGKQPNYRTVTAGKSLHLCKSANSLTDGPKICKKGAIRDDDGRSECGVMSLMRRP
jgi:hypothetical protein